MRRKLLFVGERRSQTAMRMGVTWEHGRLCAMTLHEALANIGVDAKDPEHVWFINLWGDHQVDVSLDETPRLVYPFAINVFNVHLADAIRYRWTIVGLGKKVQRALDAHGIPHLKLIHPAARGGIRKRERYHAHVAQVLGGDS
jgi:hypothetical protein